MPFTSYRYKLRAGSPFPEGQTGSPDFILQTFMAEKVRLEIDEAKDIYDLLATEDFRGQGGDYLQANYQRLPYKNMAGNQVFSSTEELAPIQGDWDSMFIDEDDIPGS